MNISRIKWLRVTQKRWLQIWVCSYLYILYIKYFEAPFGRHYKNKAFMNSESLDFFHHSRLRRIIWPLAYEWDLLVCRELLYQSPLCLLQLVRQPRCVLASLVPKIHADWDPDPSLISVHSYTISFPMISPNLSRLFNGLKFLITTATTQK